MQMNNSFLGHFTFINGIFLFVESKAFSCSGVFISRDWHLKLLYILKLIKSYALFVINSTLFNYKHDFEFNKIPKFYVLYENNAFMAMRYGIEFTTYFLFFKFLTILKLTWYHAISLFFSKLKPNGVKSINVRGFFSGHTS